MKTLILFDVSYIYLIVCNLDINSYFTLSLHTHTLVNLLGYSLCRIHIYIRTHILSLSLSLSLSLIPFTFLKLSFNLENKLLLIIVKSLFIKYNFKMLFKSFVFCFTFYSICFQKLICFCYATVELYYGL